MGCRSSIPGNYTAEMHCSKQLWSSYVPTAVKSSATAKWGHACMLWHHQRPPGAVFVCSLT